MLRSIFANVTINLRTKFRHRGVSKLCPFLFSRKEKQL